MKILKTAQPKDSDDFHSSHFIQSLFSIFQSLTPYKYLKLMGAGLKPHSVFSIKFNFMLDWNFTFVDSFSFNPHSSDT